MQFLQLRMTEDDERLGKGRKRRKEGRPEVRKEEGGGKNKSIIGHKEVIRYEE